MNEDLNNAVKIKNLYISSLLYEGGFAVDATVGNGHDTLFLSNTVGSTGKVIGFDIQESAISSATELLASKAQYSNHELFCDCHTCLKKYIHTPADLFVYNLGYLPGGDKSRTTDAKTTIQSIKTAMSLLKDRGVILAVCYPGHSNGSMEEKAIREFTSTLNQKLWSVLRSEFINQINEPPVLYFVQKR